MLKINVVMAVVVMAAVVVAAAVAVAADVSLAGKPIVSLLAWAGRPSSSQLICAASLDC